MSVNVHECHDDIDIVHIVGEHLSGFHSLCGLCDVPEWVEDTDRRANCDACIGVIELVFQLAHERGTIEKMPTKRYMARARRAT